MNALFKYVFTVTAATIVLLPFSFAWGFPWDSASQKNISWSDNLRQAQELSRQTGKPVLLHFFSDTCPPCKMMEKSTFPNSTISETVQNLFIPVKLNVKHYPREAQKFNVQGVPMDIVLAPDGQQIQTAVGGQDASRYSQFLSTAQVAVKTYMDKTAKSEQVGIASISGRDVNLDPPPAISPFVDESTVQDADSLPPLPDFPASPTPDSLSQDNTPRMGVQPKIEAGGACPINETPSFNYAAIPDEEKTMIELEGYCPVELSQHSMWIRGDYNNRLIFEDRLYFFAGKAQMEEFQRNPRKYAPMYQGIDIVALKDRGERVHGIRNYGAWAIEGTVVRVYLFSSEENLRKFEERPEDYLPENQE